MYESLTRGKTEQKRWLYAEMFSWGDVVHGEERRVMWVVCFVAWTSKTENVGGTMNAKCGEADCHFSLLL